MKKPNGNLQVEAPASVSELPESRQAAWAQSMALFQETGDKLDKARQEIASLKAEIAGYKVALDAKDAIAADVESRIQTMQLVRDEAVTRYARLETMVAGVFAQMRAFPIPSVPHVTGADDDQAPA